MAEVFVMSSDEIEAVVLAELRADRPRKFIDLVVKVGGYHGGNYRSLDRQLQVMRRRGTIHYRKGKGCGWYLGPLTESEPK